MLELRHVLLGFLLDSLWQVPLIVLIALLCSYVLRRASVSVRHRLWVGALFLCVLLPLASSSSWYDSMFGTLGSWHARGHSVRSLQSDGAAVAHLSEHETHLFGMNLGSALLLVWGIVVLYRVACLIWAWRRTQMFVRRAREVELSDSVVRVWESSLSKFGRTKAQLLVSDEMVTPATVGAREPVILLSSSLLSRTAEPELAAIFAHELAHVSRGDFLRNLVYEVVAIPLIYHPATFWLRRQIAGSREMVCDDLAANRLGDAQGYARSLLQVAKSLAGMQRSPVHALGIFESGDLEGRIMSLMSSTSRLSRRATTFVVVLCSVFFGVCCVAASVFHFQPQVIAAEELPPFAGSWQWMFKGKPFVTMVLIPSGDHFTGYMTNGYFRNDDDGNMTEAGAYPGRSPVLRSFFAGSVLHIVVQDGEKNTDEWTMTLVGTDSAEFNSADPDRPKSMKPWMAVRSPDATPVKTEGMSRIREDGTAPN
jgi:beta-lactamase regulating signal transducer with metallopeptidase domain